MREAVIVSACRTAVGTMLGSLSSFHPKEFAIATGKECIQRAGITPDMIDEVVAGCVIQAGLGGNIARQISYGLGIDPKAGAVTVNQLCSSSMRAFEIACQNIMSGHTDIALVCGVESMSGAPYLVHKGRTGYRLGPGKLEDAMLYDGLICTICGYHMGITAENVAEKYGISRQEQDELALLSQQRLAAAQAANKFADGEIIPFEIKTKKGVTWFDRDEHGKPETTLESLAKLAPAFKKGGTVTAGNASGINDGGCAAIVMAREKADELGIKPLAKVLSTATAGVPAEVMGLGPARAMPKALKFAGLTFDDIEYWEINEAFAAQWLGVGRMLKEEQGWVIDMDKVNHNGSGISIGHPIGMTGLRIIIACLYELQRMGATVGGASLCVGGGPAMATIISRDI
ncbi:MAG: thiolase family protein [Syntrophomonadaceae bacterium]|nr:thiolase family protein [Syntrophomonadaceae bacterium]